MRYLLGFLGGVIVATTVSVFAQSGLPWADNPTQWQMQQDMYRQQQSIMNDGGISEQRRRAGLPPFNRRNPC